MRYDAPYLVKRLAHPIGRLERPRVVAVHYQTYSVEDALRVVQGEREHAAHLRARIAANEYPHADQWYRDKLAWLESAAFWVERRAQPATRRRPRAA